MGQRAAGVADAELGGSHHAACGGIGRHPAQCSLGQSERGPGSEFQRRESGAHQQHRRSLRARGPLSQAGVGGARVPGTLQDGGLRRPQGLVVGEGLQRPIERHGRLREVPGTHPYQLRETVVRLDETWLELQAVAQRGLAALEGALRDQAAGVGVVQRCRLVSARQGVLCEALGFLMSPRHVQGDRQRMSGRKVVRRRGDETAVSGDRFFLTAQGDERADVLRRQFRVGLAAEAHGVGHRERAIRAPGVVVVTGEQQRRARIGRRAPGRALQKRLGFTGATAAEQQLAQSRKRGRPVRIQRERAAQELFRRRRIAQRLLGAGQQPQCFHEARVGGEDRLELVVGGAKTACPEQLTDAPHGVEERRSHRGHLIKSWPAPLGSVSLPRAAPCYREDRESKSPLASP